MYTYVTSVKLRISAECIPGLFQRLLETFQRLYEKEPEFTQASNETARLRELLGEFCYDITEHSEDGSIVIDDINVEELDSEKDPVLCALDGITPPGSFVTLYGDDNSQWQIRYDKSLHWTVRGEVTFPLDADRAFPCIFKPGN